MPELRGHHFEYERFPRNGTNLKVKQADTVVVLYSLGQATLARTFYDAVTGVDGPAMTQAIFATGCLNVGADMQ